jgi:hypothetical protein
MRLFSRVRDWVTDSGEPLAADETAVGGVGEPRDEHGALAADGGSSQSGGEDAPAVTVEQHDTTAHDTTAHDTGEATNDEPTDTDELPSDEPTANNDPTSGAETDTDETPSDESTGRSGPDDEPAGEDESDAEPAGEDEPDDELNVDDDLLLDSIGSPVFMIDTDGRCS